MRRIPIRLKLASALALPLAALAVVSVLEFAEASRWVNELNRQADLARASIGPASPVTALQDERTWPAVELVGFTDAQVPVAGYDESRAATDRALREFEAAVEDADRAVQDAFAPALAGLDALAQLREDIDGSTAPKDGLNIGFASEVFDRYTAVIEPFFTAAERVSLSVDGDADLRQGTELADTLARAIEVQSRMLAYTLSDAYLTPGGVDTSAEIARIAMLQSEFQDRAHTLATPTGPFLEIAETYYPTELIESTNEQVTTAIRTGTVDLAGTMDAVNVPIEEGFLAYQAAIREAVDERAEDLDATADRQSLLFAGLGLVAVVATITLTLVVSRSITRPLRSLTRQAKEMAHRGLPEAVLDVLETPLGEDVSVSDIAPIRVKARDEVRDVADALNTVQDSALDLAVEQAVLRRNIADSFTNLGRRNQNLLSRQLDFITELESHEVDPDTFAALFRLDHLATRMRRNAESLLVLAGVGPPRRWAAPVAIVDVIRASFGEVETYERAVVRDVEPVMVMGAAAADLAHLLAELLENALTFSSPDQQVEVRGRRREDGAYTVAVIDAGFGMPDDELAQANRRLAGTESFTVAPSKYLGHYVAGSLAARHGIEIRLSPAPGQGTMALVVLPAALLAADTGGGAGGTFGSTGTLGRIGPGGRPTSAAPAAPVAPAQPAASLPPAGPAGQHATSQGPAIDVGPAAWNASPPAARSSHAPPSDPARRAAAPPRTGTWGGDPLAPAPAGGPWGSGTGTGAGGPSASDPLDGVPSRPMWAALADPRGARPITRQAGPARDPGSGGTTAGGLTRRVSGAQLPSTQPRAIRRPTPELAPGAARGSGRADAQAQARDDARVEAAAGDVYDFLSRFTAGVRRGLDDSATDAPPRP